MALLAALTCSASPARVAAVEPPPSVDTERRSGSPTPELRAPRDLAPLLGKPIARVEVITLGGLWDERTPVASPRPGEPFTPGAARRAARELTATGRYAAVDVEAVLRPEGVVLRLAVLPRRLIAAVRLRGGVLDEEETRRAADLAEGREITAPLLEAIARRVAAHYRKHGYTGARVTARALDTDARERVVVDVEITPGAPRTVLERTIEVAAGAHPSAAELAGRYAVGVGARVDEVVLADADRALTELLRARGFHGAVVGHALEPPDDPRRLRVRVEPGPLHVLRFEGHDRFDRDQLAAALDLEGSTDRRPTALAERLREFYLLRGFLDAEVTASVRGGAVDPVHHLVLSIREGAPVRVVRRTFPCLTGDRSAREVAREIDSFLDEEIPGGSDVLTWVDPASVDAALGPRGPRGARPRPAGLPAAEVYAPGAYDRAVRHLRDLYRSEGYLSVQVGPVVVLRRTCDPRSPPGRCRSLPGPSPLASACRVDVSGVPLEEPPLDPRFTCRTDRARHVGCAPEVELRIPIQLGPRTMLYDLAFEGNRSLAGRTLGEAADLSLGAPLSTVALEAARGRVLDAYRAEGFAYAEVEVEPELSPDRTRARARFYVTEREQVRVTGFVVRGASRVDEGLILRRVALEEGGLYRRGDVRKTEERVAALGTFTSVSVSLEDPHVPSRYKRVVIQVAERVPQYTDAGFGFSTGDGVRVLFEYGHRNVAGRAVQLTLRVQLNYLPDPFILDADVRNNYDALSVRERLERRNSASLVLPEVGLGPVVTLGLDGIDVRDNARDFGLTKEAASATLTVRPERSLTLQAGPSVELNSVEIFNRQRVQAAILKTPALRSLLLVPEGDSVATSLRGSISLDRRDDAFSPTRGGLVALGAEAVRAFPDDETTAVDGEFIRLTARLTGYLPLLGRRGSLAATLRAGYNAQLTATSRTYPDRLFFLGGVDSLRGFLADSLVPQDLADRVLDGELSIEEIPIRGGDVFVNPRAELRLPLDPTFKLGVFLDAGNLWVDPAALDPFRLRYAAGLGLRIDTPVGPLALDYGVNLLRRPFEDFGAFHFSIGLF